jgi:hypothetical protein
MVTDDPAWRGDGRSFSPQASGDGIITPTHSSPSLSPFPSGVEAGHPTRLPSRPHGVPTDGGGLPWCAVSMRAATRWAHCCGFPRCESSGGHGSSFRRPGAIIVAVIRDLDADWETIELSSGAHRILRASTDNPPATSHLCRTQAAPNYCVANIASTHSGELSSTPDCTCATYASADRQRARSHGQPVARHPKRR